MRGGSKVPEDFEAEGRVIARRLARTLKLSPAGRVTLGRELELLVKRCASATIAMVQEEFILTPRDKRDEPPAR